MKPGSFYSICLPFLFMSSPATACEPDGSHIPTPSESLRHINPTTHPALSHLPNSKLHLTLHCDDYLPRREQTTQILRDLLDINFNLISHPSWSPYPPLTASITTLTITTISSDSSPSDDQLWKDITRIFYILPNLSEIHWTGRQAITTSLLAIIAQTSPTAKLFYSISTHSTDSAIPHNSLVSSTNLHSLSIILYYSYYRDSATLPLILSLLQTCQNLKELSLTVLENSCEPSQSHYAFDFTSLPANTTLAARLEVLKIDGYDFTAFPDGVGRWNWQRRKDLSLLKTEMARMMGDRDDLAMNLEAWKRVMDFSLLQTLEIRSPNTRTLTSLSGNVVGELKELSLTGWNQSWHGEEQQVVREFVRDLTHPLESLSLTHTSGEKDNFGDVVDIVTQKHGGTLRSFKFGDQITLPSAPLDFLLTTCPLLSRLEISLPYPLILNEKPDWHPQLLSLPTTSPTLKILKLHFPSPPTNYENMMKQIREWEMQFEDDEIVVVSLETLRLEAEYQLELRRRRDRAADADVLDEIFSKSTVLDLFVKLRRREVEGPLRFGEIVGLEKLDVYMGDWENREAAIGAGPGGRGDRIRVSFWRCWVDDGGDEKCEGKQTRSVNYGGDRMVYLTS